MPIGSKHPYLGCGSLKTANKTKMFYSKNVPLRDQPTSTRLMRMYFCHDAIPYVSSTALLAELETPVCSFISPRNSAKQLV